MFRRGTAPRLSTKALSPYAQALKHVALRGAAALGPSAKEQELTMYRAGTLAADYRPPVQGKWDDTIERWAYAWQFPSTEVSEDTTLQDILKSTELPKLVDFARLLLTSPPSKLPGSAETSLVYPFVTPTAGGAPTAAVSGDRSLPLLGGDDNDDATARNAFYDALEATAADVLMGAQPAAAVHGLPSPSAEAPAASTDATASAALAAAASGSTAGVTSVPSYANMVPASSYSAQTGVPAAYLDDGSELSVASKTLATLLETSFRVAYEEPGIAVVLMALSMSGYWEEARSLFSFARDVGLGPTTEMYRALMRYHTRRADVNRAMALIEEMKEEGVTPRIGNWHELMMCLHKAKDYPAVQQVVDHMKAYANIEPNEATFALQLKALARDHTQLSVVPEAIQLFDQMENVYGFIASRSHYHGLMACLSQSPKPEWRQRCEELGKKMECMGIVWDQATYLYQIMSAQVVGDVKAVEALFGKMRNEGVQMTVAHLAWAIHGHTQALLRLDYAAYKDRNEDVVPKMLETISTCYSMYQLVLDRGWRVERVLINALLVLMCQSTMLVMEHCPDDATTTGRMEAQANAIWFKTFDEVGATRDVFSYQAYIALLAHQQRIDEAEKLFQELCLQHDATPTRRTYEALIFMHLSSGEEGGTARALHYLEAMERAGIHIRPSLIRKIVRVNDASGYKRDMKRRARRIMQAREEFLARKEEGVDMTPKPYEPPTRDAEGNLVAVPLPVAADSTLAWWEKWKRESISKHELFEVEGDDGMPRGEAFAEKNAALQKMGIDSKFLTKADVPDPSKHRLLPKLRAQEGQVTGALWGLDGGELSYPKDGRGPDGWGVRLWRDRQLIKKEFDAMQAGMNGASPSELPFSSAGNAMRTAPDQLAIETSGVKTPGALQDLRAYPAHVYDDGTSKPPSEFAVDVPPSAEIVWQQEQRDRLAPYKTDDELSLEADNAFYKAMEDDREVHVDAAVSALREGRENDVSVRGKGTTRRSKHDYLEKWRDMYRHGTLEVPDEPLERYGLNPEDHKQQLSRTVRRWNDANRRVAPSEEHVERWAKEEGRAMDKATSRAALKQAATRRKRRHQKK